MLLLVDDVHCEKYTMSVSSWKLPISSHLKIRAGLTQFTTSQAGKLPFSPRRLRHVRYSNGRFQSLKRENCPLADYPSSIAWEAILCNSFREPLFLAGFHRVQCGHELSSLHVKPPVERPEILCTDTPSLRISESCAVPTWETYCHSSCRD